MSEPFKGFGMRARVYRNLGRKVPVWSVQIRVCNKCGKPWEGAEGCWGPGQGVAKGARPVWRVALKARSIRLKNAAFHVRESGRQRVLRERRKNVHAWVEGELEELNPYGEFEVNDWPLRNTTVVSYNPYREAAFMASNSGDYIPSPIHWADWAVLIPEGTVRVPREFSKRTGKAGV